MVQSKQNDAINRTENNKSSVGACALAVKSLFTRGMEPPGRRFHSSGSSFGRKYETEPKFTPPDMNRDAKDSALQAAVRPCVRRCSRA